MKIITSPNLPKPGGHYSTCIEHGGILYIAGQLPFVPGTRDKAETISGQTTQVLNNLKLILEEAGSKIDHLLQVRIYIPDVGLWDTVNMIYEKFMGDHKPVRCVVPTRDLHYNCLIEIEAIAFVE